MSTTDRKLSSTQGRRTGVPAERNADSGVAIDTALLMTGQREITIVHAGERYRLRITANDKLILTK